MRGEEARVTHAVAADTDAQHHGHGGSVSENMALAIVDDEEVDLAFKQNKLMRQLKVADGVLKEWKVQWGLLCVTRLPQ